VRRCQLTPFPQLQAYRQRDPGFKRAINAFVEAEAGGRDPAEGVPVEGKLVEGRLEPVGPVQGGERGVRSPLTVSSLTMW
jgi:hypothetical protein